MRQYKILLGLILMMFLLSGCGTRAATTDVSSLTLLDSTESAAYSFPAAAEKNETSPSTQVTVPTTEITTSTSKSTSISTSTAPDTKTSAATTTVQTNTGSPSAAISASPSTTAQERVTDPPIITTATTTG